MTTYSRYLLLLCFALVSTFSLVSQPVKAVEAKDLTYYVIKDQAGPFQIEHDGTDHKGIVSDLVFEILASKSLIAKVETLPFKRMIRKMEENNDQQWITLGSSTWTDLQSQQLSKSPIYRTQFKAIVSAKTNLNHMTADQFSTMHAILLFGFEYPGLEALIPRSNQHRVKGHLAAFKSLERDPMHGFYLDIPIRINYYQKKLDLDPDRFRVLDIAHLMPDYSIHFAYSKGLDPEIRDLFERCLLSIKSDGRLDQIIAKYQ